MNPPGPTLTVSLGSPTHVSHVFAGAPPTMRYSPLAVLRLMMAIVLMDENATVSPNTLVSEP